MNIKESFDGQNDNLYTALNQAVKEFEIYPQLDRISSQKSPGGRYDI